MTKRPDKLVLCTHNAGKRKELIALLEPLSIQVLTPADFDGFPDPVEDGDTFLANALIKARASFAFTGLPSLADDSGLVVPALNGEPGVHSARYAGVTGPDRDRANREKLHKEIATLPNEQRHAAFFCTLVYKYGPDQEVDFTGTSEGLLIDDERGTDGFGYDPMFLVPSLDQTFAQIRREEKNKRSHRGLALQKWLAWLQK
jgi:XTP/dITP diphosphohydrolase